jgi:thioredoxin 1
VSGGEDTGHDESGRCVVKAFTARACVPWRLAAPDEDAVAKAGGTLVVVDVDVDPGEAETYEVVSLPTVLILVDNIERRRLVGAMTASEVLAVTSEVATAADSER